MGLSPLVLGDLGHPSTFPDQGWVACSLQQGVCKVSQCWGRGGPKAERTGSQRWGGGGRYALASLNGLRPLGSRGVVFSSVGNQGYDCGGMKGAGGDSLPGLRLSLASGPGHSSHVWLQVWKEGAGPSVGSGWRMGSGAHCQVLVVAWPGWSGAGAR